MGGDDPAGVTPIAHFEIEGVIVGDQRSWDEARFDLVDEAALASLGEVGGIDEQIIVVTDPPSLNQLESSVTER